MRKFFEYNWQIRDEWFDWCKQLTTEQLNKKWIGGTGSILYTLFHIVEVEYSWVRGIQGKEDRIYTFNDYETLEKVKQLSVELRIEIAGFHIDAVKDVSVKVPWDQDMYTIDAILHHIVAHEIHHIGQLSVWSRVLNLEPVGAHFIGRKFS